MGDEPGALSTLISNADRRGLLVLVAERLGQLTERDAAQILRHPHASEGVILEILSSRVLMASRSVRRLVAGHPQTPRHDALHALDDLLWRDLMDLGRDTRTPPPVRQAANRRLREGLRSMASGEKIALARFAHPDLFRDLFAEPDLRVLAALLQNPRLTAADVQAWVAAGRPRPESLAALARDATWSRRPPVRAILVVHPDLPRASALSLLASASREELRRVVGQPGVDPLLKACAKERLENARIPSKSR